MLDGRSLLGMLLLAAGLRLFEEWQTEGRPAIVRAVDLDWWEDWRGLVLPRWSRSAQADLVALVRAGEMAAVCRHRTDSEETIH